MKLFEKVKIKLKDEHIREIRIFGITCFSYVKLKNKIKYIFPCKVNNKTINKNRPVFYLKINRNDDVAIKCLQHWLNIIDELDSDYYILCDKKELKDKILKNITFRDGNFKFLKSYRNSELSYIVKNIATKIWINATYAHLTSFYHSKINNIQSFWNIDADDTMFCLNKSKVAACLKSIEDYAAVNDIAAFSFDMHRSRTKGKHWSFGVTYTQNNMDWFKLLKKNKDLSWREKYEDYDNEFNLDWYFTYLKDNKVINLRTFCLRNMLFVHFGDVINNPIYAWAGIYTENKIKFPILLDLYNSKKYGEIDIHKDVVCFDGNFTLKDCYDYMVKENCYLEVSSKQHDNMWG